MPFLKKVVVGDDEDAVARAARPAVTVVDAQGARSAAQLAAAVARTPARRRSG